MVIPRDIGVYKCYYASLSWYNYVKQISYMYLRIPG
jgi:hypothetical protein